MAMTTTTTTTMTTQKKKTMFAEATMALLMLLLMMPATLTSGQVIHFHQDTDTHHTLEIMDHPRHPERGYVENCGPGGGFFDISWQPKDLSPATRIEFFANFTSPTDLEAVHVQGELNYEGSRMLSIDRRYRCEDIAQSIDDFVREGLQLDCPIRKGEQLSGSFVYAETTQLIGFDGDYDLKLTIKDVHGNGLMCVRVKATIQPFD